MSDVLSILVLGLILVGMFVALMAWNRLLRHRELITLAERGLVPPPKQRKPGRLNAGLMLSAIGVALCLGLHAESVDAYPNAFLGLSPIMLFGLLPLFIGLALLLSWQLGRGEVQAPNAAAWGPPIPEPEPEVEYEEAMPGHELPDVPGWLEAQGEPLPAGVTRSRPGREADVG